jgi:hypothetical protein
MFPLSTLCAVLVDIIGALTLRTKLLYTNQIRDVQPGRVRVLRILRCLKIVKYEHYSVA